jgi:hypothetical protein
MSGAIHHPRLPSGYVRRKLYLKVPSLLCSTVHFTESRNDLFIDHGMKLLHVPNLRYILTFRGFRRG